jgi:hypothetical protein
VRVRLRCVARTRSGAMTPSPSARMRRPTAGPAGGAGAVGVCVQKGGDEPGRARGHCGLLPGRLPTRAGAPGGAAALTRRHHTKVRASARCGCCVSAAATAVLLSVGLGATGQPTWRHARVLPLHLLLPGTHRSYLVAAGSRALYVAFMGTKQARDISTDLAFAHEAVWAATEQHEAAQQGVPGVSMRARCCWCCWCCWCCC